MAVQQVRAERGRLAYHAGVAAEDNVARSYQDRGYRLSNTRWRSAGGEIDLVFRRGTEVIFVEVKKSRTFGAAALRVSSAQKARIFAAARIFISGEPAGQLTNTRFDVALVNAVGEIDILENALFEG